MADQVKRPSKKSMKPTAEQNYEETTTPPTPEIVPAEPAPMELAVLENTVTFRWNFEEIKARLIEATAKYNGLVVTEENLADMEKTCREIAGLRVRAESFRLETKRKLAEPANKFDAEVKELLEIIRQAENPIRAQVQQYEVERVNKRIFALAELAKATGESMGLRPEYRYEVPAKLAQRSVSDKQARAEVVAAIESLVQQQARDDAAKAEAERMASERAAAIRQAGAMLQATCASLSQLAGLATPVSAAEVYATVPSDASPEEITQAVVAAVNKQKAIEQAAAAKVAPQPMPAPDLQEPSGRVFSGVDMSSGADYSVQTIVIGPPIGQPVELPRRFNVTLQLDAVTMDHAKTMVALMRQLGVVYTVISQVEVPG